MPPSEITHDQPAAQVIPFTFDQHDVRVVMRNGQPWWVAKDVCVILEITEAHRSLAGLDEDEKGRHTVTTLGGPQDMAIINEPGLYSLVLRSRKPEARRFKRWITHKVLPAIRKTGSYTAPEMSLVQQIEAMLAVARRQEVCERQVAATRRIAQAALDKAESNFGMYTVMGFARLHGLDVDLKSAAAHGNRLVRICQGLGIPTGNLRDPRFGRVNTYPEGILEDYFHQEGLMEITHA